MVLLDAPHQAVVSVDCAYFYTLRSLQSNLVATVRDGSTYIGAAVMQQGFAAGAENQQFLFINRGGDGMFSIHPRHAPHLVLE